MSTALALGKEITTAVSLQVRDYIGQGSLQLPPNYSAENALKAAMLILPDIKTKTEEPVLIACSPESVQNALLSMCIQGLNPDKKQCYFIAYGKKLTMTRSYFGDIAVAKQVDPFIEEIYPGVVFEGDKFEYDIKRGKIVEIRHSQKLENKNKPIIAAYATVLYRNGDEVSTVMTYEKIKQAWKQSITKPIDDKGVLKPDSTHGKYPEEMAKKTVVHKACKPIINSSNDSNLMVKFAKQSSDEADAIETEAIIEEEANTKIFDAEFVDEEEAVEEEPF